jgi:N-methylhydantoinase A/oxoprolinase/acetone carboxylase beta subunit
MKSNEEEIIRAAEIIMDANIQNIAVSGIFSVQDNK